MVHSYALRAYSSVDHKTSKPHRSGTTKRVNNKKRNLEKIMFLLRILFFLIALEACLHCSCSVTDFSPTLHDRPEEDLELDLVHINGTLDDFRVNITLDLTGKPWYDDRKERYRCVRRAKCEKLLQNSTCFGSKIKYKYTSVQLSDEENQEYIAKKLQQLEAFRNIPECWAVIQPFLCAVYMPKCIISKTKEYVYLPSMEMCRVASEKCRLLYDILPENLRCNNKTFPCENCNNDVREMKFNAIAQCMSPLIPIDSSINHYPGIEGCELQCKDPRYNDDEHESVHALIFWGTLLCILSNLFVIATFLIHDWKHSKHPAWNLFYISICFLCNWVGWMLQFIPGHREEIVCRRDGTLRYSEPSGHENLACVVPFILIYYFLIAANVWFAIFTYAWYLQTKDRGNIRDRIDKESFYLHFIAWALPFVLTVTIIVLSEVDGNSIIGICFVGYRDRSIRTGLVLVPVGILSFGVSTFFSFKGILNLERFKRCSSCNEESKKLNSHMLGMGIRTMLVVFFLLAFFMIDSHEVRNADLWAKSLNEFIICKIKERYSGNMARCKLQNRPSVNILQLRLICLFCVNLVISSWCWTWPAFKTWERFIKRKTGQELSEDAKFTKPKHRIIADAYAKRMDDVISVSYQNSYSDPAGINFDMNNLNVAESVTMGATLTNYLSNIINRRNAVTEADFDDQNGSCGSSCADNNSEISVNVRQVSIESRRNSIDSQVSQVSFKVSETNIKATLNSQKHKGYKVKAKRRQRNILSSKRTNRRASSSSVESQRITNQMKQFKYKHIPGYPGFQVSANTLDRQIERRSACTKVDINAMNQLRKKMKICSLTSDEDQLNDGSQIMQITNEPLNMVVPFKGHSHQMTDSDHSLDKSHDKQSMDAIEILIKKLRNSSDKEIEEFLRNSRNQMKQERSQRYTQNDNDLASSMSSSMDVAMEQFQHVDGVQSSFSDQSLNRVKTQTQNSKHSCDVGIQANDYDISSHTHHRSRGDCDKDNLPEKQQLNPQINHQQEDEYTETHQLLPGRKSSSIVRRENLGSKHLSKSQRNELINELLMPYKI